jgi:two-component system osmolarity sensor histidine kinase EnvZ
MQITVPKLKSFLPRSFFGRAVLIVVVPILVIQIVLSIVFVQRHYERVTQQMTSSVLDVVAVLVHDLHLLPDARQGAVRGQSVQLATALGIDLVPLDRVPDTGGNGLAWYDLAGQEILSVLRAQAPGYLDAVLRMDPDRAVLWMSVDAGIVQVSIPRNRLAPTNPHQLLVIVFAASVVMMMVALQYLRLQIRPIRRLGAAAEAYGRGQSLALRASGAREIRAAALAFMDMRNRIDRQNAQRKLMLSGLGHDMRTPLTRMRLLLSMSEPSEDTDAMTAEIADLENLLNGFLDYARGEGIGREDLFDPVTIVSDMVKRYSVAGHLLHLQIDPDTPRQLRLREGQLERALDNILGNALEHGTKAQVTLGRERDMFVLSVEDDGPGIPQADRMRACEPFVRLDTARNQNTGAHMGLGLAIVQDMAQAHGGRVRLEDGTTLPGLRVRLTLPIAD